MPRKTLADWLAWQESLNPDEIDLGLDRVRAVAARLPLAPPPDRVFVVAGTNGKGSCVAALEAVLLAVGKRPGVYTSPHLVHYNERVRVAGRAADDADLVDAFEQIEAVRGDVRLTFFEYGTLAALLLFSRADCDAWVLEVGLGGRLDAVNIIDGDFCAVTSVALDHTEWLGDSVAAIAREKAGIYRPSRPVWFGSSPVPESLRQYAEQLGCTLLTPDHGYGLQAGEQT